MAPTCRAEWLLSRCAGCGAASAAAAPAGRAGVAFGSVQDKRAAALSVRNLLAGGASLADIIAGGASVAAIRAAGVSEKAIRDARAEVRQAAADARLAAGKVLSVDAIAELMSASDVKPGDLQRWKDIGVKFATLRNSLQQLSSAVFNKGTLALYPEAAPAYAAKNSTERTVNCVLRPS